MSIENLQIVEQFIHVRRSAGHRDKHRHNEDKINETSQLVIETGNRVTCAKRKERRNGGDGKREDEGVKEHFQNTVFAYEQQFVIIKSEARKSPLIIEELVVVWLEGVYKHPYQR